MSAPPPTGGGDEPDDRDPDPGHAVAGRPQLPRLRRRGGGGDRSAARHRPGPRPGGGAGRADHPRRRDAHPQRLRHRRAGARPAGRRRVPGLGRRRRGVRATARARRRRDRRRAGAAPCHPHTRPHVHAPGLRARGRRPAGARRVHRRLTAVRLDRPAGPPRRSAHRDPRPAPVRVRAPAGRAAAGRTPVLPTHGFGSFCSATPAHGSSSTVAEECRRNPVLTEDEDTFVAGLLDGLTAYPAYYAHMAPLNAAGPGTGRADAARAGRPGRRCARASGPASGWSTCGVGRRTRRATCRGRSTSASTAAS